MVSDSVSRNCCLVYRMWSRLPSWRVIPTKPSKDSIASDSGSTCCGLADIESTCTFGSVPLARVEAPPKFSMCQAVKPSRRSQGGSDRFRSPVTVSHSPVPRTDVGQSAMNQPSQLSSASTPFLAESESRKTRRKKEPLIAKTTQLKKIELA